ncbi:MAG: DNA polymerase/3'-5' exonuclease PolX [Thermotogae bacterium]|nr:DNA polymerase/3'-5' exonuclease PolX [Thermotogota bacterium]
MRKNEEVAEILDRLADALEFLGEIPFKVRAYRRAARAIEGLPEDIEEIYRRRGLEGLMDIPGVGERIAKKIAEYLETGRMRKYEEVMEQVPKDLIDLLGVPGIGPKTLKVAYERLGVRSKEDFRRVLEDGSLARLPGFGPKKVENIRRALRMYERMAGRIPLGLAYPIVERIVEALKGFPGVLEINPAGSFRRMKETVGDIDILVSAAPEDGSKIIREFVSLPEVVRVLAAGETKGSAIFGRYQVDLRVIPPDSYGAALQYFTGSKQHNIHLRTIARSMGLKISEYGVFRGSERIAGRTEEEVYGAVGLVWIPPELREDRGEIEAAARGELPDLVDYSDIRGDLHVHSRYSDGVATLEEIALAAAKMGYEYVAVCDHSQSAKYAGGLDVETLRAKNAEIDRLNATLKGIRLLKGAEVDILPDGSLDYPDEVLAELDFVIGAIHSWRKGEDTTERILKAMENPYVHTIAHPTGRLIGRREGYGLDVEAVIRKAVETGTFLEVNGYYERLDLNDINARMAKMQGARITLGTDAHQVGQLWQMRLAVGTARRGWLEKSDVINVLPLDELLEVLGRKRRRAGV